MFERHGTRDQLVEEVLSHLQWQVEQCRTEERRQRGRLILRGFRAAVAAFESTSNVDKIDALLREEIFGAERGAPTRGKR